MFITGHAHGGRAVLLVTNSNSKIALRAYRGRTVSRSPMCSIFLTLPILTGVRTASARTIRLHQATLDAVARRPTCGPKFGPQDGQEPRYTAGPEAAHLTVGQVQRNGSGSEVRARSRFLLAERKQEVGPQADRGDTPRGLTFKSDNKQAFKGDILPE